VVVELLGFCFGNKETKMKRRMIPTRTKKMKAKRKVEALIPNFFDLCNWLYT
jgi:hypothetical protein